MMMYEYSHILKCLPMCCANQPYLIKRNKILKQIVILK